jgi:hypothetical protein
MVSSASLLHAVIKVSKASRRMSDFFMGWMGGGVW